MGDAEGYRCDGCGAPLGAAEDLERVATATGRAWRCGYCGVTVPTRIAERLQHRSDGSPTDRRP